MCYKHCRTLSVQNLLSTMSLPTMNYKLKHRHSYIIFRGIPKGDSSATVVRGHRHLQPCTLQSMWDNLLWTHTTSLQIQGDSLGGSPEVISINRAIIFRRKRNLASIYLGRYGDNFITDDDEIGSLRLETQADRRSSVIYTYTANQAGSHQISVAKFSFHR
jgi:hypothetical protein